MKKQVIGIDISKDTLDFCILDVNSVQVKDRGVIDNQLKTIKKWLRSVDSSSSMFALEHTGHYGAILINQLSANSCVHYLINPLELKKSLGIQRGKSDKIMKKSVWAKLTKED